MEGKRAVAFLRFSCSVIERSASWVAMGGKVRVSIENGIITTIVSSPEKNCLFQLKLETLNPDPCLQE